MVKKVNATRADKNVYLCYMPKVLIASALLAISFSQASAQSYPPTILIPVTFYDFHSDGSNPEFEKSPSGAATRLGMVATTLDAQRKPQLGPTPYWDCDIAKWFRAWTPGDLTIPNYTTPVTTTCSNPVSTVNYDTAFKNVVIDTFLTLTLVPGSAGIYRFNDAAFFPLDGKGFGAEVAQGTLRTHNYSFTMELHWQFVNIPGLTFHFAGDDDMWAFVNNNLVMDLGGIHNTTTGTLNVDDLNLPNHSTNTFDIFYCERHVTGSDLLIETNIFSQPAIVQIYQITPDNPSDTSHPVGPLDSAVSGIPLNLAAHFYDSTGTLRSDLDNQIIWTMTDSLGTVITKLNGDSTTLLPRGAYGTLTLTATLTTPNGVYTQTIQIYIGPGKPNRINIQDTSAITSLRSDQRLLTLTMNENTATHTLYAVLRDSLGNYIGPANNASWSSSDTLYATVVSANATNSWRGIITKIKSGQILIIARSSGVTPDTVVVTLLARKIEGIISTAPAHTPAGPNNPIPPNSPIVNFYQNVLQHSGSSGPVNGALIGIHSKGAPLTQRTGGTGNGVSYGDAVVYDAVGNLVAKDLKVYYANKNAADTTYSYGVYWNCHNQNGRWIGNGTYLMEVSTTNTNNITKTTPIKVGFSR
jgi:fibro-slime domain